jgi:NAD-dependent dihydropyrimidine dehydrogenase PreA subunit
MTYVVTSPCVGTKDKSCVDVCPVDCIHDAGEQMVIDPVECIDCGACEPVCPVDAILFEAELPRHEHAALVAARVHFGLDGTT